MNLIAAPMLNPKAKNNVKNHTYKILNPIKNTTIIRFVTNSSQDFRENMYYL